MSAHAGGRRWKRTLMICAGIVLVGAAVLLVVFSTEPAAERGGATKQTAMLVDVAPAVRGTFRPTIVATGTVRPAQEIVLAPRVSGEIVGLAPEFVPGGFVARGDTLLVVEPADYEHALQGLRGDLQQAEADLRIELGRQNVAEEGYELLDETLAPENEELVLRRPQLNAARARVEAARAAVAQGELDLRRTRIRAPFDAQVLTREVNVGSQVERGERLGRLVGVDEYWVVATVPVDRVRWLTFPDAAGETGSPVRIHHRTAWPDSVYRLGRLHRLVGALEEQTRLARVLVTVPDPLAGEPLAAADGEVADRERPPLMIGSFVQVSIEGREVADVVRIRRDHVRKDDTVWVMQDGKLEIREVDIALRDGEYAYVARGLEEGDRVVTTDLATVAEGAGLRLAGDDGAAAASDTASTARPGDTAGGERAGDTANTAQGTR